MSLILHSMTIGAMTILNGEMCLGHVCDDLKEIAYFKDSKYLSVEDGIEY